jgi:hypothetical protein
MDHDECWAIDDLQNSDNALSLTRIDDEVSLLHIASHDIHGLMQATNETLQSPDADIKVVMADGPVNPGMVQSLSNFPNILSSRPASWTFSSSKHHSLYYFRGQRNRDTGHSDGWCREDARMRET